MLEAFGFGIWKHGTGPSRTVRVQSDSLQIAHEHLPRAQLRLFSRLLRDFKVHGAFRGDSAQTLLLMLLLGCLSLLARRILLFSLWSRDFAVRSRAQLARRLVLSDVPGIDPAIGLCSAAFSKSEG